MADGDPAAMRGLASQLMGMAVGLRPIPKKAIKALDKAQIEGTWADALKAALAGHVKRYTNAADALERAAMILNASALVVEQQIEAERLEQLRLAREAAAKTPGGGR